MPLISTKFPPLMVTMESRERLLNVLLFMYTEKPSPDTEMIPYDMGMFSDRYDPVIILFSMNIYAFLRVLCT